MLDIMMRLQKAARKWASAKNTDKSEDVLVSTISEEERVMMNDVDGKDDLHMITVMSVCFVWLK